MIHVAIVGGGPSGLYALKALTEHPEVGEITVFEAGERWGLGTPYDPALNHPSLLANIGSFELPPLVDSLADWLASLAETKRTALGVAEVSDRAFYPRVVLGAYFEAQFAKLAAKSRARVRGYPATRVHDVGGRPDGATILFASDGGPLQSAHFDFVIIATGHRSRPRPAHAALTKPAYPAPDWPPERPLNAAILGASLTAIDATLSMALARGEFEETAQGLRYRRDAAALKVTMLSRRGLLPEADFYFRHPYDPLRFCDARALSKAAAEGGLDAAFALLRRELQAEDPEWSASVDLDSLTPDTFADAYFASRSGDPFERARRNLEDVRESQRSKRVSPYRYAILRAHEAFSEVAPHLGARDRVRFRRGLRGVFVDNYAAVPPLSIARLLALHEAGVLDVKRVAPDYRLERAGAGVAIASKQGKERYDVVIDARGEGEALPCELPFPTLRLQILANEMAAGDAHPSDLSVTDALALSPGVNPVGRVYILAAPFLLSRRPFVQGLTSAHELSVRAVADLVPRAAERPSPPSASASSGALYLGDGLIVTTAPGGQAHGAHK